MTREKTVYKVDNYDIIKGGQWENFNKKYKVDNYQNYDFIKGGQLENINIEYKVDNWTLDSWKVKLVAFECK